MNKSDYNKLFGNYIKNKRESKGWTQIDLASFIGNNSQNISRMERGEITPTIFWLEKLADTFECKVSDLLTEFEAYREDISQKKEEKRSTFND
ncbi:MAG: helix-turn-helix domain protein [Crocinitomicaceae bacterium]|jgi:ribosome-binding protein aMBF1 (putative translation factor)|nr:helix-turn-helix domain protein [Crocinitomicaceae bacterium]